MQDCRQKHLPVPYAHNGPSATLYFPCLFTKPSMSAPQQWIPKRIHFADLKRPSHFYKSVEEEEASWGMTFEELVSSWKRKVNPCFRPAQNSVPDGDGGGGREGGGRSPVGLWALTKAGAAATGRSGCPLGHSVGIRPNPLVRNKKRIFLFRKIFLKVQVAGCSYL